MTNDDRPETREGPAGQEQSGRTVGGAQAGGGPVESDMEAGGGSSSAGGHGRAQNQMFHQGQESDQASREVKDGRSRGQRFDEAQGGGRGPDDLARDQAEHQDRGQSQAEREMKQD